MVFKALSKRYQAHEQVIFCSDFETGLKAIIAIHSTALGPALGGCRMYPYKMEEQALQDVLRLSEAMSHKAVMVDLGLSGGKSVIIADPEKDKTPELFRSFGRHVESLNGRYIVAKDMGITTEDLQYMGEQSSHVIGRPVNKGGIGDPGRWTAKGVYYGIKEAVRLKLKRNFLKGVRVVVQGVGSVGWNLVDFLTQDQAEVFVCDVKEDLLIKVKARFPNVSIISEEEVFSAPCEVFSPCSVGSVINEKSVEKLKCPIIAGGANNQLDSPLRGEQLIQKDILYVPDFIINGGGLIYVSSCLPFSKRSNEWIESKIKEIPSTLRTICKLSSEQKVGTAQAALNLAREKIKKSRYKLDVAKYKKSE